MSSRQINVINHPLAQHKLTLMRKVETSTNSFRRMMSELSLLIGYEVTRDLPTNEIEINTPLETTMSKVIDGKKIVLISILRAGSGMLDGMLEIMPSARVGHIGLYRDPKTLIAVEYYFKVPAEMKERDVIIVDPMLATGNSAIAAVERIKELGPRSIKFACVITCPEGIKQFHDEHPDVPIYTVSIDRQLDDHGYIRPGLGDAGDRVFGTK